MGGWLKRNWWRVLNSGIDLAVAATLIVVLWNYVRIVGIVIGLFILQHRTATMLVGLTWQAAKDKAIDLRESNRRMGVIFGSEALVLLGLVIASLFSEFRWIALLPGIKQPMRTYGFFRFRNEYHKQPAGEYMHKGKYD